MYLTPQLKGLLMELGASAWGQETRMIRLPGRERSLTISSAVWIQYMNVTDEQTDRQTDRHRTTAKTALMHSIAR